MAMDLILGSDKARFVKHIEDLESEYKKGIYLAQLSILEIIRLTNILCNQFPSIESKTRRYSKANLLLLYFKTGIFVFPGLSTDII